MFIACSASLAGTAVTTLAQSSFNAGMERVMLAASYNYQAEFVALMRQLGRGQIATRKINVLDAPAIGASNISFVEVTQGGTANTTYKTIAGAATSLVVPRILNWSAGGPATISYEIIFLSSNGTATPITIVATAGTATAEADVYVGDGTGISQITVDFGYDIQVPGDGHLYPINAYISSQRPSISYVTNGVDDLVSAKASPGAIGTVSAVFKKLASGGVRGTGRTYTIGGHVHISSVANGTPGTVAVMCAGTGGLTIT